MNNFGRGIPDEATYLISKTFWFQTRRFLKFFPIWVYVKQASDKKIFLNFS